MKMKERMILFLLSLCLFACLSSSPGNQEALLEPEQYSNPDLIPDEDRSGCVVIEPPLEMRLDPFYTKYCSALGIGIVASEEVDDLALKQAYYIIYNILAPIPAVRNVLVADGHYIAIIGKDQEQTTLPEYAQMDSSYWDYRARGLGGGKDNPVTSCGEENLLCLGRRTDRYFGENILIHEFAHTIHLGGLGVKEDEFWNELGMLYYKAREAGLWENTYAITNLEEYWAEGVQTYFNSNIGSALGDGVHIYVNTREELAQYDPALYGFIARFFYGFEWTPTCPER